MRHEKTPRTATARWVMLACLALLLPSIARAQARASAQAPPAASKPTFEIYGFAILDIGHDFK
jgi:hypothetical protein